MRIAVFSSRSYDRDFLDPEARRLGHELVHFHHHLNRETAPSASGFQGVCVFVQDQLDEATLVQLQALGVKLIALRCAGFNQVDLKAAARLGLTVCRVPAYSPESVAEHAIALTLALARRIPRAYNRVREGNFNLEGLTGFCLHGKTVGLVGLGKIGVATARIFQGFGCQVLAFDPLGPAQTGITLVDWDSLLAQADILSLHCPLTPQTKHLVGKEAILRMKAGVVLINTSRGGVIDTRALIDGLKSGRIGAVGLDVYEEEADLFFEDLSEKVLQDDIFARLLSFPNVLVTGHQGFFTQEALQAIAQITCQNITAFAKDGICPFPVTEAHLAPKPTKSPEWRMGRE